jgi:hypothetical protein
MLGKELNHKIKLCIGDWSCDGHNQMENIYINCNVFIEDLESAYKTGAEKIGVDITEDLCNEYDDNKIEFSRIEKFALHGFKPSMIDIDVEPDDIHCGGENTDGDGFDPLSVDSIMFTKLWLFTAITGNPDIRYEIISDDVPEVNIGGYGLFTR